MTRRGGRRTDDRAMRGAEECEHEQRRMRNAQSWTQAGPRLMRWPGVATRGPSVASRGQGVCPGAIGRALGRALTKRTSDTLNVAGRLGGPDSVWNTSGRDFRAPVLGLHCRCPYGTTLEKAHPHVHSQCTTSGQKPQTTLALSLVGLNERAGCQQRQQVEVTPTGRREKTTDTHMHDGTRQWEESAPAQARGARPPC